MNEKDTFVSIKRLSSDEGYYASVFKKIEKITSVLSYIVSHINKTQKDSVHAKRVQDKSLIVHDTALESLTLTHEDAGTGLVELQHRLVSLESTLRVAQAAGVMSDDVLQLVVEQIDSVQRYINNHYTKNNGYSLDIAATALPPVSGGSNPSGQSNSTKKPPPAARRKRVQIPAGDISSDAYLVYSQMTDRAERIKTVLEAKPQATIKDIAEVITDVSEKTIQRELNSLIEKGQVVREGERRWSKYSIKK